MRYTVGMSFARRLAVLLVTVLIAAALSACGAPAEPTLEPTSVVNPLQSPLQTSPVTAQAQTAVAISVLPTSTSGPAEATAPPAPAIPTLAPATSIVNVPDIDTRQPTNPTVTPAGTPTETPIIPFGTISPTLLTSTAVVGTITALAATPTYPPTDTPRPRRRPVIIGAAGDSVPPTTAPDKTGITVQTKSDRVFPGGPATLTIKTKAGAACELSNIRPANGMVDSKEVLEPISSGSARNAGSDGAIAWIWKVDADEPAGPMRLVIMCPNVGVKQINMDVMEVSP